MSSPTRTALLTSLLACTPAAPPPPEQAPPLAQAPPSEPPPAPPGQTESPPAPALRLAYRGCPGKLGVHAVAGDILIEYVTDGIGRIDRLAPNGTVAETLDLEGHRLDAILDLDGPTRDDLYLSVATFRGGDGFDAPVFHRSGSRWSLLKDIEATALHPRGADDMLMYMPRGELGNPLAVFTASRGAAPDLTEVLPHARAAGAGSADDEVTQHFGIQLKALSIPRTGPILAVVTYEHPDTMRGPEPPVGTWMMAWRSDGTLERVDRITTNIIDEVAFFGSSSDGAYLRLDSIVYLWRAGTLTPIPDPLMPVGETLTPLAVDPDGRLWASHGSALQQWDGATWHAGTLPGPSPVDAIAGIEVGTPWVLLADETLWSRSPAGAWLRHDLPDLRVAEPEFVLALNSLYVPAAADPWLLRSFPGHDARRSQNHTGVTDLYTSRPLAAPNPCRLAPSK